MIAALPLIGSHELCILALIGLRTRLSHTDWLFIPHVYILYWFTGWVSVNLYRDLVLNDSDD